MKNSKFDQEKTNPCLKEHNITYKCLDKNSYNKDMCSLQIDNYNLCKSFWGQIKSQRRKQGIRPYLPVPEDRQQIKDDFFESFIKSTS